MTGLKHSLILSTISILNTSELNIFIWMFEIHARMSGGHDKSSNGFVSFSDGNKDKIPTMQRQKYFVFK